jgi:hypothetical protein
MKENHVRSPFFSRNLWKTGLLLTGSALFGGLAVAFWHRRTLQNLKQAAYQEPPFPPARAAAPDDDVIF